MSKIVGNLLKTTISDRKSTRESRRIHVIGKKKSVDFPSEISMDYRGKISVGHSNEIQKQDFRRITDAKFPSENPTDNRRHVVSDGLPMASEYIYINKTII